MMGGRGASATTDTKVSLPPIADITCGAHKCLVIGALLLSSVAAFAAPPPEAAASGQPADTYIVGVAARPDKCNLALAKNVDVRTIASHPEQWTGKCVAVDGYWQLRTLFAQRSDARTSYSMSSKALQNRRIGIYGPDRLLAAAPSAPAAYTAVGIVGQCERLWAQAVMVMGYCHYTDGPYLAVAEMKAR